MKIIHFLTALILSGSVLLAACQPVTPTVTPPVNHEIGEEAVVEGLELVFLESFPLQAQVILMGYTPDGCTSLEEISVERQEATFELTLITKRIVGDVACTEALVPFVERVDLDIAGLEAGTYTVIAQEQQTTFTLEVDNVLPDQQKQSFEFGSGAVVESLSVEILESLPIQVTVTLTGYLPDGCTEIVAVKSTREGQTFRVEVVTRRQTGDVACTMAIIPFEEHLSLDVAGLPAGEYIVKYADLSEKFILEADQ